jgi:CMP-N-acetylneuraminic acid synthetase/spore coat polysaccharide biosynthesis predicted glycosyltransferase SpsG
MYKKNNIVTIIPARGGSKGIPKKNIKPLQGKPLLSYSIEAVQKSRLIDSYFVSTENEQIINLLEKLDYKYKKRPDNLAKDDVTLDEVIYHETKNLNNEFNYVITIQPTCPFVTTETIDKCIKKLIDKGKNSILTIVDKTHLYWKEKDGVIVPKYEKRLNRQYLSKTYQETGAVIGCKCEYLLENKNRLDPESVTFIEVSQEEAIDIDNYQDWVLAESILNKKKIAINVIGNEKDGLGHVYRQLNLAFNLPFPVNFFVKENNKLAIKKIRDNNYPVNGYKTNDELIEILKKQEYKIIINDILDTSRKFVQNLKDKNFKVISFEDLGEGANNSDIVFNALFEFSQNNHENKKYGYKYCLLRQDVVMSSKKKVKKDVNTILITCGGVDENNLTLKYLKGLEIINYSGKVVVILGPGYKHNVDIENLELQNIEILKDVKSMAKYMLNADLILTSNGRTIYEATCIGTPTVALCQNHRELSHTFSFFSGAVENLGIAKFVQPREIAKVIRNLINDFDRRKTLNQNMLRYDLKKGKDRVISLIQNI